MLEIKKKGASSVDLEAEVKKLLDDLAIPPLFTGPVLPAKDPDPLPEYQDPPEGMLKWEHKVVRFLAGNDWKYRQELMNKLGAQGWSVMTVVTLGGGMTEYVFTREKLDED